MREREKKKKMSWDEFNKRVDAWCESQGIGPVTWKERKEAERAEKKIREKKAERELPR